jgi:predicted RND superfamily exporter protein
VGHPVRDSYDEIGRVLSGISPVNIMIEGLGEETVTEPAALSAVDRLTHHMEALPDVGKALAITDPLRQLHGAFEGDPAQPLPATRALTEQYLLLLESVDQIEDLITDDRNAANVILRVNDNGSLNLMQVGDEARRWWAANGPAGYSARPTGIMYEFARAEDEMAFGQIRGLTIALAIISVIIFSIFRWPRLALVSLIPNAIPLVMIFGVMGLLGLPLDAGTVLMGGMALGIAVDDTIHISTGFFERARNGEDASQALRETFSAVLPAIISTTVMISAAFLVLAQSEFTLTRNLGLLTASIMILCLLADITLLAALLLRVPMRAPVDAAPRTDVEAAAR